MSVKIKGNPARENAGLRRVWSSIALELKEKLVKSKNFQIQLILDYIIT
jgi:hypothetical protein